MKLTGRVRRAVLLCLLSAAGGAALCSGQFLSGGVYGAIAGPDGKPLGGASVKLTGPSPTKPVVTGPDGQFRFLGLDPGNYRLRAEAAGLEPAAYPSVAVGPGRNTTVQVRMSARPNETITVTAEPPQFDGGHFTPVLTVSRAEIQSIPTPRDPWALAMLAPGVITSEVNSGGSASGQQPLLVAPGANSEQNAFVFDGVVITDMAATGASPTYFDIDQFDRVQVGAGGSDPSRANAGVTIDMVTRSPTNEWRGSLRVFTTNDPSAAETRPSNAVKQVREAGGDLGGGLVAEHAWIWGAASTSHVLRRAFAGAPVDIRLDNETGKLNLQTSPGNSGVLLYNRSFKLWNGRGASPTRSRETWLRQTGAVQLWKLEDTLLVGSNWSFTGFASALDGNYAFRPFAGADAEPVYGADGIWRNSWFTSVSQRNARQWRLVGNAMLKQEHTDDDVVFGLGQRGFTDAYRQFAGRRNLYFQAGETVGETQDLMVAMRDGEMRTQLSYGEAWAQDTVRRGPYTFGLGARLDEQSGRVEPTHLAANPALPELLPAADLPGLGPQFTWRSLSPRIGVVRQFGRDARTLLGASYSRFAAQLGSATAARGSSSGSYSYFLFDDQNGDHIYQPGETYQALGTVDMGLDRVDNRLRPEVTDAVALGLEHRLRNDWQVRLDLIRRVASDVLESRQLVADATGQVRQATSGDYQFERLLSAKLPNGRLVQPALYSLRPGLATQGRLLVNGDRERVYQGATLSVERPFHDGWMVRGNATLGDWRWRIGPRFRAHDDPTDSAVGTYPDGIETADSAGEIVAQQADQSSRRDTFLNSGWSFGISGMATVAPQEPWSFLVASNISGRQGFPVPYAVRAFGTDGVMRWVQATRTGDEFRAPDLYTVDLRLEKDFQRRDVKFAVSLEAFNLFNSHVVLQQSRQLNSAGGQVLETLGSRVLRAGVRVSFR